VRVPVFYKPDGHIKPTEFSLFASADDGKTWKNAQSITPDEDSFIFCAPDDGLYWLALQVYGGDGKVEPGDMRKAEPQLKLLVKTGNSKASALDTKSLEAASEEWNVRMKEFIHGGGTQGVLYDSARALFLLQLENAKSKADRIAAWEAHLGRASQIERFSKERYEAGRIFAGEYEASKCWRLGAEKGLHREKGQ
jgi:hypothetical protein